MVRTASGTVHNIGTLASTGVYNTVDLFAGGSLTNGSNASTKALITGSTLVSGVDVNGGAGTVTNFGTIGARWGWPCASVAGSPTAVPARPRL